MSIRELPDGMAEITLSQPIVDSTDETINKIKFRTRLTWKDAKAMGSTDNQMDSAIKLFAGLTFFPRLTEEQVGEIDLSDVNEIASYIEKIILKHNTTKKKMVKP